MTFSIIEQMAVSTMFRREHNSQVWDDSGFQQLQVSA